MIILPNKMQNAISQMHVGYMYDISVANPAYIKWA